VAFAVEGDGVGFATESYAASALYTTLANLSGAYWRIRRANRAGHVWRAVRVASYLLPFPLGGPTVATSDAISAIRFFHIWSPLRGLEHLRSDCLRQLIRQSPKPS